MARSCYRSTAATNWTQAHLECILAPWSALDDEVVVSVACADMSGMEGQPHQPCSMSCTTFCSGTSTVCTPQQVILDCIAHFGTRSRLCRAVQCECVLLSMHCDVCTCEHLHAWHREHFRARRRCTLQISMLLFHADSTAQYCRSLRGCT